VLFAIGSAVVARPLLPAVVFVAETCVVTLSTVRTIFLARGRKVPAACLGFFEISIWLFAIGQVMQNLTSLDCYLAFASGFSLGNFLGVVIEQKLALGNVVVQITTRNDPTRLAQNLRTAGYGVTMLDAEGATGPVRVVFTVIQRKQREQVLDLIERFDPKAFYAVNDVQSAAEGIFPGTRRRTVPALGYLLLQMRRSLRTLPDAIAARTRSDSGGPIDARRGRTGVDASVP
jgi:uncharacterized protein YebE (UPF0316 family)